MSPYFIIENLIKDPDIPKMEETHSTFFFFLHEPFSPEFHVFVTFQTSHLLTLWHMENPAGTASLQKVYFGSKALFSVSQRSRTKSWASASFFWGSSLSFLSIQQKNAQKLVHSQNTNPLF